MTTGYPPDWKDRKKKVYQRDDYICQQCGARGGRNGTHELHAHHKVPKSKGGSHDLDNLVTLCKECHENKHPHMGDTGTISIPVRSALIQFVKIVIGSIIASILLLIFFGFGLRAGFSPFTLMFVVLMICISILYTRQNRISLDWR